jgi:hypothetical protein
MCQVVLPHRKLSLKVEGLDYASTGEPMYSKKQFTALETMCREQAGLAKSEMEYSLMKYWLAEAEEETTQTVCPIQRKNCKPLK